MTRDEIIQMALDVGLYSGNPRTPGTGNMILTRLQRFAELVAAKECEACAKICEGMSAPPELGLEIQDKMLLAAAKSIRARGNQ